MNKSAHNPVSTFVRIASTLPLLLLPLLLGSCSSSRSVNSDKVLDPGQHVVGTLIDSDVLIPKNASLQVDYLSGNRIFVASGGSLSGFHKGAKNTTIYAEKGALLSGIKIQHRRTVTLIGVDNADEAFRDRFKNLLPAGARSTGNRGAVGGGVLLGAGYFGGNYWGGGWGGGFGGRGFNRGGFNRGGFNRGGGRFSGGGFSGGGARATSVSPRSYRSRN